MYKFENVQPKVLWGTNLRQLVEDNKTMTSKQLAEKYNLSLPTICRYQKFIKAGTIRFEDRPAPKKYTPNELIEIHKDKIAYRAWC